MLVARLLLARLLVARLACEHLLLPMARLLVEGLLMALARLLVGRLVMARLLLDWRHSSQLLLGHGLLDSSEVLGGHGLLGPGPGGQQRLLLLDDLGLLARTQAGHLGLGGYRVRLRWIVLKGVFFTGHIKIPGLKLDATNFCKCQMCKT